MQLYFSVFFFFSHLPIYITHLYKILDDHKHFIYRCFTDIYKFYSRNFYQISPSLFFKKEIPFHWKTLMAFVPNCRSVEQRIWGVKYLPQWIASRKGPREKEWLNFLDLDVKLRTKGSHFSLNKNIIAYAHAQRHT